MNVLERDGCIKAEEEKENVLIPQRDAHSVYTQETFNLLLPHQNRLYRFVFYLYISVPFHHPYILMEIDPLLTGKKHVKAETYFDR